MAEKETKKENKNFLRENSVLIACLCKYSVSVLIASDKMQNYLWSTDYKFILEQVKTYDKIILKYI